MSENEPPAALSDCGERRGSPAAGATAIAPHLVFLPDRAAPRFFVWGAGAAAAPLFAHGKPECVPLVDEALALRELHGVAVPLLDALTRLAATTAAETERAPASLAAWSLAAKLALDLVGRERIVPRVVSGKGGTEARFAVALALPEDAERVAALAKGFPLAAHAVPVGDAGLGRGGRRAPEVWAPEALLRAFLDATADALVRAAVGLDASRRPRRRKAGHVPWERRFIAALAGPDAAFAPEGFRERTLVRDLDGWTRPALGAAPGAPRACFRLDLPAANGTESGSGAPVAGAFPLRFFLQAADDPSLLVPASEVLGGRGQALRRLGRSFHDGAEHLLGALAVAARLFAPIGRSLREARPEAVLLDASEAWAFLTEGAPALAEAGIGVILPAELTRSGQRRLRLRMRVGGAQKGAAGAVAGASGLTAAEVMSFRWEAALAGETLSARDFAALAELKAPLVRFRGEWVAVDPTELAEVRRLVASGGGTLAAHEGLAAVLGETVRRPDGHVPVDVVAEGPLASLVTRLREGLAGGGPPVPSDFHGRLRPYQERGLGWLVQMSELGLGACLADDMGLGKTIQLLALLPRLGQSVQARRGRALRTGRGVRPGSIPAVRAAWPRQGGRARRAAAVPRRAEQRGARGEGGCSQQRRSRPHGHAGRPGPGGVRAAPWPARRLAFPDRAARIARDALAPARCAAVVVARRSSSRSPRSALPGGGRSRARSRAASNRRARPDLRPERCAP